MIHETPEGCRYHIGINYWFPKDNNTLWMIAFCVPLFIWYQRDYYDMMSDRTKTGWRVWKFSFRIRKRNAAKFPEGFGPMLLTSVSFYATNLLTKTHINVVCK